MLSSDASMLRSNLLGCKYANIYLRVYCRSNRFCRGEKCQDRSVLVGETTTMTGVRHRLIRAAGVFDQQPGIGDIR